MRASIANSKPLGDCSLLIIARGEWSETIFKEHIQSVQRGPNVPNKHMRPYVLIRYNYICPPN